MSEFLASLKEKLGDSADVNFEEIEQAYSQDISGLKNKNSELLQAQSKIKNELNEVKNKFSSIDVDKYQEVMSKWEEMQLKQEVDEETKAKANNDLEFFKKKEEARLKKMEETWTKREQDLLGELQIYKSKHESNLIDLNLTSELKNVNVGDEFLSYMKKAFKSEAFVGFDEEGKEQVMIKDGGAEVQLKDFISAWSLSDEAKAFIVEPSTIGSGSKGSASASVSRKQQLMEQIKEAVNNRDSLKAMHLQAQLERLG